ncbi:hypothetical protein JCM8547_002903 [Rhodosporidiobolus lusitaniae]
MPSHRSKGRRPPATASTAKTSRRNGLSVLQLPYEALASAFAAFGHLLSTHQTASLLCTALIICSLLSPALLLTFSPSGSPFDISASAITRRGRGELVWELDGMRRQGLISTEEEVCWDRVKRYYEMTGREGGGRRIRVEQVLVSVAEPRGAVGSRGTIGKSVLHRLWRVQKELERRLLAGEVQGNRCLTLGAGEEKRCATISPTGWWKSEDDLLQDGDVHRTLSSSPVAAAPQNLPLTLSEAFVGIGRDRQGTVKSAQALVIAFILQDEPFPLPHPSSPSPTSSNMTRVEDVARHSAKAAWRRAVRDVVDYKDWPSLDGIAPLDPMGLTTESRLPSRHVLLKFLPHLIVDAHPRRLENVIYAIGYILITLYVSRYIRKLRAHSKMGLLVTGIVELTASGIMSVSICWLLGWSLALVPWNLLAFLVLTSGLDNMILVLRAIATTDMNLPVPQRMSIGLRSVGVEMTILLLVEEVMAVALLGFVEINVMREWIRFGAVVLVVDYFLELTFFSTVLSIDIQRLELADLLTQQSPVQQTNPFPHAANGSAKLHSSPWSVGNMARAAWKVLRDRPAKTSTVAFLWLINVLLWAFYGSEHYLPAACSQTALSSDRPFLSPSLSPAISRSLRLGQSADPASSSHLEVPLSSASAFWALVNPSNTTSVQVYLEPTVSVQFFDDETLTAPESIDLLHSSAAGGAESGPSFVKKAMLVILPIAVVMTLLYCLLLYLLKDAELLQAHWGSEERLGGPAARRRKKQDEGRKRPEAGIEVMRELKVRHEGDVELVATGGEVVASWAGLGEKVLVKKSLGEEGESSTMRLDIPLSADPTSLVALSVDGTGQSCAAATTKGRLLVWSLQRGGGLLDFGSSPSSSSIVSLLATPRSPSKRKDRSRETTPTGTPAPPISLASRIKADEREKDAAFYTLHRDGNVTRWDYRTCRTEVVIAGEANQSVARRWLVPAAEDGEAPLLAVSHRGGRLVVHSFGASSSAVFDQVVAQTDEQITTVTLGSFPLAAAGEAAPTEQVVVVVGLSSGSVAVYSLCTPSTRLATTGDFGSPIRYIRLVDSPSPTFCPTCNEEITEGVTLLASTRTTLHVLRLFTPPTSPSFEPCTCNSSNASIVSRSRSSSAGVLTSPSMSRTISAGAGSRRFSPRKRPATPSRPTQLSPSSLGLEGSPLRPPMPNGRGTGSSYSSHSSSGTTSPSLERSQPLFPPPPPFVPSSPSPPIPPPPLSTSSSSYSLSAYDTSPFLPSSAVPLPPPAMTDPLISSASPPLASTSALRTVELATVALDERSGWTVLSAPSGPKATGLRRARKGGLESGRGWEVWTVGLGKREGSFEEGYEEGATELGEVLAEGEEEEEEVEEEEDGELVTPASTPSSSLRRRNPPAPSSPAALRTRLPSLTSPSTSASPFVRFIPAPSSLSSSDLPFSRARPLVPALNGAAFAVGLGNQVAVFQSKREDGVGGAGRLVGLVGGGGGGRVGNGVSRLRRKEENFFSVA